MKIAVFYFFRKFAGYFFLVSAAALIFLFLATGASLSTLPTLIHIALFSGGLLGTYLLSRTFDAANLWHFYDNLCFDRRILLGSAIVVSQLLNALVPAQWILSSLIQ